MEMSAALRAPQQAPQQPQAPTPVQGLDDPFTQGGFGTGGFGMGQYQGAAPTDREYTAGAMSGMGTTSLGGGGTGSGGIRREAEAAAARQAQEQRAFDARREQEVMDGGMLVKRDLTRDEQRAKSNALHMTESGDYTDPRIEESYGRDLTEREQHDKRMAQTMTESGDWTDPRISAEQHAASARYQARMNAQP